MGAILSLLYDLLVAPLAIVYGASYHVCARAFGYGYGLLALSALTTLLLHPLRGKVAATQEEERRLRRAIEPQLARIRAESDGEERHRRVRRLYRRYAYHPIMSIRAMWGLLLQAPFILAAYHMLSELAGLRFISFWGISSLASPDGLLPGGVNLLPLLMTALNLAAALLTPGATKRETGQAVAIAALFLALLYKAPSALLIYWTANNFLSLVEVLLSRYRSGGGMGRDAVDDVVDVPGALTAKNGTPEAPAAWLAVYAFALAAVPLTLGHFLRWRVEAMHSGSSPYYFTFSWLELLLAAGLAAAAVVGARRAFAGRAAGTGMGRLRVAAVCACAASAGFLVCGWLLSPRMRTVSGKLFIWTTLAYALLALLAWGVACARPNAGLLRRFGREAERSGFSLYWPAVFAGAGLLALFVPMASFLSAPEAFSFSGGGALRSLLPYFLCAVYIFLYLRVILSREKISRLGLALAYLVTVGLVLAVAFPPAGVIDGNAFIPDGDGSRWTPLARDAAAAVAVLALLFALARKRAMRYAAYGLGVCAFAFAAFGAYAAVAAPGDAGPAAAAAPERPSAPDTELPPYHHRLFSLSPDKPNVMIFMFDMFHGGDVGRMLKDDPAMAERLPGFVWYRDTLSDGNNTLLSFPAVLGGPGYTPRAINERTDGNLVEKVLRSTTEMPGRFLKAGYAVSCYNIRGNLNVHGGKTLTDMLAYTGDELLDVTVPPEYTRMARDAILPETDAAQGNQTAFLLAVSVFRTAPGLFREALDDWGLFETDDIGERVFRNVAVPLLMPRFLTVDSPLPTFKIFANEFCHNPYLLGPDSLVPLEKDERLAVIKSGNAHYFTDRHAIRLMEKIVAWLRENRVYDNTRIILVSDHDNKNDPHPYLSGAPAFLPSDPKPHALLMVKDFDAKGPLRVSERLMQGHDTPALACQGLPAETAPPPLPPDDPERVRRHFFGRSNVKSHAEDRFTKLSTFTVTGSMFEASNWSQPE